jgi:hypothetical protein
VEILEAFIELVVGPVEPMDVQEYYPLNEDDKQDDGKLLSLNTLHSFH